jgi:primosomal protein N' (replication factor Y) (superfamily II helicase)
MNPDSHRVRVVLLTQAIAPLDYRLPDDMSARPGCVVTVPLGPRKLPGVVWDDDIFQDEPVDAKKLRAVLEVVECPPIGPGLRRLVNWVADYYLTSHAAVLRMVLSSSAAFTASGTITEYRRTGFEPSRLTPQRAAALDALEDAQGLVRELAAEAGVSDAVIRGLIKAGAFEPVTISVDTPFPEPQANFYTPDLNEAQAAAAGAMVAAVATGGFDTFVLDGVTGSGKTETYFEAVAEAMRQAGARTAPRDRIDSTVSQAFRGALRRRTGGLAFQYAINSAPPSVARGLRWRCESARWSTIGIVPALRKPRANHRR